MPPESKKPSALSRVFSRLNNHRSKPAVALACVQLEGPPTVAAGPSSSSHPPTHSVLDSSLPGGSSIFQCREIQPPVRPSGSENEIVDYLECTALSKPGNQDLLQPPPLSTLHFYDHPAGSKAHGGTTCFLAGASGFRMRDVHYIDASQVTVHTGGGAGDRLIDGWELLMKKAAPNALHDSDARYDPPKCDEDTRVEVTGEIMDWMMDRDGPQRLLCMTGAAGSGKSALQQTTAEKCFKNGTLGSTFFFSASDPTRNTVKPVIPTIAYQLGRTNTTLRRRIRAAVEDDPLIFDKSLRTQISTLIAEPLQRFKNIGMDFTALPYTILIDGLDECMGEDRQAELLTAVRECLLIDGLPFRVFIASRPEWAIRTALEAGGHLYKVAYHIRLNDQYDPSADMRRYLRRRFEDIGLRTRDPEWFSEGDIETLVRAGSGQFIYVATVYKYISERRASPSERLKIVLTWTPHKGRATRPFEVLDRLYTNILSAAKNAYEAVDSHHRRDFLLLLRVYHTGISKLGFPVDVLSALLCLEPRAEEVLISDLRSLVALETDSVRGLRLHLYHKTFSDFLEEPSRAKDLFVPESRVYAHLPKCFMQYIIKCPLDFDSLPAEWEELPLPELHRRSLMEAVEDLPIFLNRVDCDIDEDEVVGFTQNGGWQKINNLLPLLNRSSDEWLPGTFEDWIEPLRSFTISLKARKPEAAVVISAFAEKWKNDCEQYKDERRRKSN
ncbi:hypothetical protein H1R20_g13280, partial [Candolleomyces eurysporus]